MNTTGERRPYTPAKTPIHSQAQSEIQRRTQTCLDSLRTDTVLHLSSDEDSGMRAHDATESLPTMARNGQILTQWVVVSNRPQLSNVFG